MIRCRNQGFTLIELLIVIAIIAIICGSSMSLITAPMFERARAEDQESFESGAAALFTTIVQDAHRASSLDTPTTGTLILAGADPGTSDVVYTLDTSGTLTRKVGDGQAASLLRSVSAFTVEPPAAGSLSTITLEAKIRGYRSAQDSVRRQMLINIGSEAWMGRV